MAQAGTESDKTLKSGVVHLRSLTGLRFIAAFVVFASHVQYFAFPEAKHLPLGGPAVSFFFVLSGFILTYVYRDRLTVRGVPRFLFTRWARLWPLHIVCLAIAIWFLKVPIGADPEGRSSYASLCAHVLMLQSWIPIRFWFVDFNAVAWSISTELFFYVFFPFLLLGSNKQFWLKVLGVFLLWAVFMKWAAGNLPAGNVPAWTDMNSIAVAFPLVRLLEFVVGMAACHWMMQRNVTFVGEVSERRSQYWTDTLWELLAVGLVLLWWIVMVKTRFTNFMIRTPEIGPLIGTWTRVGGGLFFYAFVFMVFASRRGLLGQLMASRFFVWLGEISFAFYLIHQIIIVQLNKLALSDFQFAWISFVVALMASALLYRIVEMPCRDGLLAIYDRKSGWFRKTTSGIRDVLTSKTGLAQIGVLVLLLGMMWVRPVDDLNFAKCQKIIDQTPVELQGIYFQDEGRLLGVQAKRVETGVMIRMVWSRERSWSRSRFLHICDSDGNILTQGPNKVDAFVENPPFSPFIDQVLLTKRKIKGAAYVAVGFWSEEAQAAKVVNREAEMHGYRIKLVEFKDLK